MNYSLRDGLVFFTFLALFLGTSLQESTGVIWALAVYCVASVSGVVLGAEAATQILGSVRAAIVKKSVRPMLEILVWKRMLINLAVALFLIVSVVSANFVINEGSRVNPMLFLAPTFGVYVGWRILGP